MTAEGTEAEDLERCRRLIAENKIEELKNELSELRAGIRETRQMFMVGRVPAGLLALDELGEEE
jgi:hypothetical protein